MKALAILGLSCAELSFISSSSSIASGSIMKFNIQWLAKGQEKLKKIPLRWVDGVSIGTIFNKFFLEKSLKHLRLSKVHLKQIYFAVVQILTFYESCHCFYREVVETETI